MSADLFAGLSVDGARANANGMTVIARPRRLAALLGRRRAPRPPRSPRDRAAKWLRNAMAALAVLALTAAAVSYQAQYVMVRGYKGSAVIAALQAGIPDVGAMVFASLGIALALQGKHAIRPRLLNVACVGLSIAMNALAASAGWTALAVWVMPAAVYAVASDTLIGVIRAWSIARQRALAEDLADDESTPLAVLGGLLLWLLRLVLAPPSTVRGFRSWVVDEVKVAPGRTAATVTAPVRVQAIGPATAKGPAKRVSGGGKQARLIELAGKRHDLATLPLADVSRAATDLAAAAELHPGTARRVLLAHVRALQGANGSTP